VLPDRATAQARQREADRLQILTKTPLASVKAKVGTVTRQGPNKPRVVLLHRLAQVPRGWTSCFRHGASKATFDYLRRFAWRRGADAAGPEIPPRGLEVDYRGPHVDVVGGDRGDREEVVAFGERGLRRAGCDHDEVGVVERAGRVPAGADEEVDVGGLVLRGEGVEQVTDPHPGAGPRPAIRRGVGARGSCARRPAG